ncbi:MAG: LysR family transcriptional regulator [Pseudomonadota bacterium]
MTYRIPPLNGLRAFEAAARNLSFKLAANELGVTAGAVSQQVKKLETSLGIALFRRLPHGLLLTEEGEAYHPRISRALEDLTEATEAIAPDLNARKFLLGLCPKAAGMLPKRWPRHSSALDNFVSDNRSTSDLALILDNKLDCLVRTGVGAAGGLSAITIEGGAPSPGDEPLQFICRNGLIECRQSRAIIADLRACMA